MTLLQRAVGVLLVVLVTGPAYATVLSGAAAAMQPVSLDFGETTIYADTLRILEGQPLYQAVAGPPYMVTPYTPLYHLLAAALRAAFGDGFGPGRVLSLLSGLATACLIAFITARVARSVWPGAFGGLLFLALAFPGGTPWLGLYRVDTLGVALSVAAIAILSVDRRTRACILAGGFAALALLCKQSFVAAALTGVIWLWPERRRALTFAATVAGVVAVPCIWLQATTGVFLQNILAPVNPFDMTVGETLGQQFIVTQWLPLALCVAFLVLGRPWRSPEGRLLLIYWIASSLTLLGLPKVGANHNYWIEFAAATAMLAGLGAASLVRVRPPALGVASAAGVVVLVGVVLGGGAIQVAVGGTGGVFTTRQKVADDIAMLRAGAPDPEFASLVARVRQQSGIVLADPPDVIVLADRPVYMEPLIYSLLLYEGAWDARPMVRAICTGQITLLVLSQPLNAPDSPVFGPFAGWPGPVLTALRDVMQPAGQEAHRDLYTPRVPANPACASTLGVA